MGNGLAGAGGWPNDNLGQGPILRRGIASGFWAGECVGLVKGMDSRMSEATLAFENASEAMAAFGEVCERMEEAIEKFVAELWRLLKGCVLTLKRWMLGYAWSQRYPRLSCAICGLTWRLPEWTIWRVSLPKGFCD